MGNLIQNLRSPTLGRGTSVTNSTGAATTAGLMVEMARKDDQYRQDIGATTITTNLKSAFDGGKPVFDSSIRLGERASLGGNKARLLGATSKSARFGIGERRGRQY